MRQAILVAAAVLLLDQSAKFAVLSVLDLDRRIAIDALPPVLNLRMAWNTGVNFGLLPGGGEAARWALVCVSAAAAAGAAWWTRRSRRLARISAGLLAGGALGNAVDRVVHGAVADFLNVSCCGIRNPYSFNVADVCVFLGAVGLALFTGGNKPRDDGGRIG